MTGLVFDIQRFSLQDGPGIRTTVFLKGCPLNCIWCHNPESISDKPELGHIETKCIYCAACMLICPEQIISVDKENKKWSVNRSKCTLCGACVVSCFPEALTIAGKEMSVEEIIDDVVKDEVYYKESGGGLTVSGGEPMHRFEFLYELLKAAKEKGIPSSIETCGLAPQKNYEKIMPMVDLFLFDYKATGNEKHLQLTGVNNKLILDNLKYLHDSGAAIEIRCPLIHDVNDYPEHMEAIAEMEKKYPKITAVRILPYHNTANSKYARYGLINNMADLPTTSDEIKNDWRKYFKTKGCSKVIVE